MLRGTEGGCVLWKNRKNEAMGKTNHLKATVMEVMEVIGILDQLINKTKMYCCIELN